MNTETELRFDGWTVNTVSGELARDGDVSRLQQQPLRVLLELCARAGTVVTREHLVKACGQRGSSTSTTASTSRSASCVSR